MHVLTSSHFVNVASQRPSGAWLVVSTLGILSNFPSSLCLSTEMFTHSVSGLGAEGVVVEIGPELACFALACIHL